MDSEPETGDGLVGAFAVNLFEVADFALGNVVVAKPANFVVDGCIAAHVFEAAAARLD